MNWQTGKQDNSHEDALLSIQSEVPKDVLGTFSDEETISSKGSEEFCTRLHAMLNMQ